MEVNTQRRAAGLKDKLPDIQKTLDTVQFLKTREVRPGSRELLAHSIIIADSVDSQAGSEPIEATFELNDTLYAKAHVPPTDEVYLWLGVRKPIHETATPSQLQEL
jgi:Prefoldin subunit